MNIFFGESPLEEKPRYIVKSLEEFLKPGSVDQLQEMMDSCRDQCAQVQAQAKAKAKKDKESKARAKEAREETAKLSQRLVVNMVEFIEEKGLLKPAMSLQPTCAYDPVGSSADAGMPEVVSWLPKIDLQFPCGPLLMFV